MSKMPEFDWKAESLADSFRSFKARMDLYCEDHEVTDAQKQATKIKLGVGDEGMRRLLASGLTAAQLRQPKELYKLFAS